jgi:hypothetical protein
VTSFPSPGDIGVSTPGQVFATNLSATQQLVLSGDLTPTALNADVNDYNPTGLSTSFAIRIDGGASDRTITGLAGGASGRELGPVTLPLAAFVVWTGLSLSWTHDLDKGSVALLFFFLPFGVVFLADTHHFAQDFGVETVGFGFRIDVADIAGQRRFFFFEPFDAFDQRLQLVGGYRCLHGWTLSGSL